MPALLGRRARICAGFNGTYEGVDADERRDVRIPGRGVRDHGAAVGVAGEHARRLESNRRELIRAQWALSAALIARYGKEAA